MSEDNKVVPIPPVTRRAFLQGSALVGFSAFLAACGTSGTATQAASQAASQAPSTAASVAPTDTPAPTPKPTASAELNFANWPLYIDVDAKDKTKHQSLDDFTAKYGTKINYKEVINANEDFFGTIKAPLEAGQDTGWDIIVMTNWMAARIIRLGWAEKFDLGDVPNYVNNLEDAFRKPDFDPNNEYHAPWQAGMTGLGFDSKVTGDLTSVASFWDSKWGKRKITFLTEMRDTVGLALYKTGASPDTVTSDQFDAAIAEIKKAKDAGLIRAFTGNEYAEDLVAGNVILSMAWSGDILQKQAEKATLKFAVPTEGGMLWYDNMLIPKGAKHKYTAELWIDYYYQPAVAAIVEAYVNYICPVKGAKDELIKIDANLGNSPLIFPPADVTARVKRFKSLTEDEEKAYNDKFSAVTGV